MKIAMPSSICYLFILNVCFIFSSLSAEEDHLKKYLLPKNHPLQRYLNQLFQSPKMFDSPNDWHLSGFQVLDKVHRQLMVAKHPSIKNYLFKKFQNTVSAKHQLDNYLKRASGAQALRLFIKRNNLKHIRAPQKWLYPLPKQFSDPTTKQKTYILIVEEMDICGGGADPMGENALRYQFISNEILEELCYVVFRFRGLDSMLHNMPFTYQNQITFIDTEKWREKRKGYLKRSMPFLRPESQAYANFIFSELEKNKIILK